MAKPSALIRRRTARTAPPAAFAQVGPAQQLDADEARRLLLSSVSEREFQQQVLDMARLLGWLAYHSWSSQHSEAGFPDLVLVHPGQRRCVFVEAKREGKRPTAAQRRWLEALGACPGVCVYVWTPSMLNDVERVLRERLP